jgi:DNA-binding transcriptional MerR regulator
MSTYSTTQVCEMTYRQVDYYCRKGLVPGQPAGPGTGSGHPRRWTQDQIDRVALLLRASRLVNATLDEAVEMLDA